MQIPATSEDFNLDPAAQWIPCYGVQANQDKPYDPVTNPLLSRLEQDWPYTWRFSSLCRTKQECLCLPLDTQPDKLLSYSMNQWASYIPEGEVYSPSEFIVLVDEQYGLNDGYFVPQNDCPSDAHNGGTNMAFFDGHVKWIRSYNPSSVCHNAVNLVLFCPQIPFDLYAGDMCKISY